MSRSVPSRPLDLNRLIVECALIGVVLVALVLLSTWTTNVSWKAVLIWLALCPPASLLIAALLHLLSDGRHDLDD